MQVLYVTNPKRMPGVQIDGPSAASLQELKTKSLPMPADCVNAFIPDEAGWHVYSARFGWEFYRRARRSD